MYEFLLAIHLLAAVTWVGGSIALTLVASRMNARERLVIARHFDWYGTRILTGSALVVLAAGIALVLHLDHVGFGDAWVLIGLGIVIASAILGGGFISRAGREINEAAAAGDVTRAEAAFSRLLTLSLVDTAIVVLAVIDMAVKPGA